MRNEPALLPGYVEEKFVRVTATSSLTRLNMETDRQGNTQMRVARSRLITEFLQLFTAGHFTAVKSKFLDSGNYSEN